MNVCRIYDIQRGWLLCLFTTLWTSKERKKKSQKSTIINSGISFKWSTAQTIEKHRFYTIETHPVIENSLVYLKTLILLLL